MTLVVVAAVALVIACGGSSSSPQGQADYLERSLKILSDMNRDVLNASSEPAILDRYLAASKEWAALHPPQQLSSTAKRFAAGLRTASATPSQDSRTAVADQRRTNVLTLNVLRTIDGYNEWALAATKYYSIVLLLEQSREMEPAFCQGDIVPFAKFGSGATSNSIGRWQLVLFTFPFDATRSSYKRVVGLPGETIEIRNGVIMINGHEMANDYAKEKPTYSTAPLTIPSHSFYVLGDNWKSSPDSHLWATTNPGKETVPEQNVLGVSSASAHGC
jgi:signal peptidase I